jgi:hypothetical protein
MIPEEELFADCEVVESLKDDPDWDSFFHDPRRRMDGDKGTIAKGVLVF